MTWISVRKWKPARPGPYLVYCGKDTDDVPIYFLVFRKNGVWLLDETDEALELEVTHWSEISPPTEDQT